MDNVKTWGEAITVSLINVGQKMTDFLPTLIGALIVLIVGWIMAVTLGRLVEKMVSELGVDSAMRKIGFGGGGKASKNGLNLEISGFIGGLVKWFLILVFLMAATDIMHLNQITIFLNRIVLYLPNVLVAVVILTAVFLLGNFVYHIVKGSTRAAGVMSATLLATISKWAIIIFGFFAALIQLGVADSLVNSMFIGLVAMLALAGGLAFGLGGRDEAQLVLKKLREELTEGRK
ncbi:MAG: hypothetical protein NTY33_01370 [Candidatus Moranbacteria bacterium]|nr:hypothetical protein [Candidatus Moranbacteria bacterium]